MSITTCVYCIVSCSHNIRSLHIQKACRESLDMVYKCIAQEVIKTSTTKNSVIVMATNKQFLANYFLKSPSNGHLLVGSSLEVVMVVLLSLQIVVILC